ncbi:MAG: hypothetical protein ACRDC4_10825, partial [Plesiomonas sp.]
RPPQQLNEAQYPFYEDDEGNVVFTFKGHASYVDKKTQEKKDIVLRIYDSKGARIQEVPQISNGSKGRVEFSLVDYVSEVAGCGIKLQLSKFQLLELKVWSGGDNDTFGGEPVEGFDGGYEADQFSTAQYGYHDDEPQYSTAKYGYQHDDEHQGGTAQDFAEDSQSYQDVDF